MSATRSHGVGGASGASLRDFHNYLVTSPTIDGDWSDPVFLNSSGFDPSLFHDDDGKKYFVNMSWDHVLTGMAGSNPQLFAAVKGGVLAFSKSLARTVAPSGYSPMKRMS